LCAVFRILDAYPGSLILIFPTSGSRIPAPESKIQQQEKGEGKLYVFLSFFVAINFTKDAEHFFDLIKVFFTIKIITNLLEICIEDPGSGKNLSRIRIQGSKKHWILDPGPQCCLCG
jgi:hypothetical protein